MKNMLRTSKKRVSYLQVVTACHLLLQRPLDNLEVVISPMDAMNILKYHQF